MWKEGYHYATRADLCDNLADALAASKGVDRTLDIHVAIALYRDKEHEDVTHHSFAALCQDKPDHNNGYYAIHAFSGISVKQAPHFSSDKLLRRLAIFSLRHDGDIRERRQQGGTK